MKIINNNYYQVVCTSVSNRNASVEEIIKNSITPLLDRAKYLILDAIPADVKNYVEENMADLNCIKKDAKLYFDKRSTFPRYKLKMSDFKCKRKVDDADYVVISKDLSFLRRSYINQTYLTHKITIGGNTYFFNTNAVATYPSISSTCKRTTLEQNVAIFNDKDYHTCEVLLNPKNKGKFIYDTDLEKLINKNNQSFDEESVQTLIDMLSSSDKESVKFACKLITSYNFSDYPLTAACILFTTMSKWYLQLGVSFTAFKSMLSTINFDPRKYYSIDDIVANFKPKSEEDKKLAKYILKPWLENKIRAVCNLQDVKDPIAHQMRITIE